MPESMFSLPVLRAKDDWEMWNRVTVRGRTEVLLFYVHAGCANGFHR